MRDQYSAPSAPTAPGTVPLLGHGLRFGRDPLAFVRSLPQHGDLVRIRLGPWSMHVVTSAELTHRVLVEDKVFDKGGPLYDKFRQAAGNGLLTCSYADHRRQRRLLQPAFRRDRITSYVPRMADCVSALTAPWRDGQHLDVATAMHELTTAVTTRVLFGVPIPATIAVIERCIEQILSAVSGMLLNPLPERIPTLGRMRFHRAQRRLRAIVSDVISRNHRNSADQDTMLTALLAARDGEQRLDDEEVHDQVMTFLIAAVETAANTMTWTWYLLDTHPNARDRVEHEADTVLRGGIATAEDLPALEYTGRVVTETLRLRSPGWLLTRAVRADIDLGGVPLPAGTIIAYSPYLLGHDDALFPDPSRFDPDRWHNITTTQLPKGAFVPFAGGARKCIGDTFAMTLMTLAVASLAGRWRLVTAGKPARPVPRAVLAPSPITMRLHRRHAGSVAA